MGGNWSEWEKPAESLHAIEYRYLIARYCNHGHRPLKTNNSN